jgi:protocatechuate 3,4-dioxygenase, alpha subunit
MKLPVTPSQTVGPYFHLGLTAQHAVGCVAGPGAKGEPVRLIFAVLDGDGKPVNDAMIEIWQANADGKYNHPDDTQDKAADPACPGFGRMGTDENGMCEFASVKPGRVPGVGDSLQAPHLNVSVFARGLLKRLVTRVYFAGDRANDEDPVLALVPADRREMLLARPDAEQARTWRFTVRLSGERETVFFDV